MDPTSDEFEPTLFQLQLLKNSVLVQFGQSSLNDEMNVDQLGFELIGLVDQRGHHRILVSLQNVKQISSSVLGKLIHLHRHLKRQGGILVLCELSPNVAEVMETSRLSTYFNIFDTLEHAKSRYEEE